MRIILLQDVVGLGRKLDVKDVSDGHALNMLIPRGLVREATSAAVRETETLKKRLEAERTIHENLLLKNFETVEGKTIHVSAKANEQGHLFAAIHESDIVKHLKEELHVDARADFIKLAEPIKTIGEHVFTIEAQGKKAKCTLVVEAEK